MKRYDNEIRTGAGRQVDTMSGDTKSGKKFEGHDAKNRSVLVMGAGAATGSAIARRFGIEGYQICLARRDKRVAGASSDIAATFRDQGITAHGFTCDARHESEVAGLIDRIEAEIAPLEVVVFNIGGNVRFPIRDTTTRVFEKVWQMACYAGFLTGREAARVMVPRQRGTILFTGATASLRGGSGYVAFSAAKAGLRMVAQSMARELGPQGVHVGHVVIDGAIDTEFIAERFPDKYETRDQDGILCPTEIAEAYWALHAQHRSAWTFELDLRPWIENW